MNLRRAYYENCDPGTKLEVGGTRFIYQLANELADKGHTVEIVLPEKASLAWPLRTKITRSGNLPGFDTTADFILPKFLSHSLSGLGIQKGPVIRLSLGYEPLWVKEAEIARTTYLIDAR